MLSINTNLSSLIAQNSMKTSSFKLDTAIERMTTGYKINHAKDNAANYSIATNMTTKIGAYMVAEDNALQGLDMINTASESLSLIEDKLMRLRALATQASNDTYGVQSKQAINAEANALVDEIGRIYSSSEYNNIKMFEGKLDEENVDSMEKFMVQFERTDTSSLTKLSSVDGTVALPRGTYSISTPEELAKLATMTNNGLISGGTFVLANDIDLEKWCKEHEAEGGWTPIGNSTEKFKGNFDGNGYVIKNLTINRPTGTYQGLFGSFDYSNTLKNLGLENVNATGSGFTGSIAGSLSYATISNCFVRNTIVNATSYSGGLYGYGDAAKAQDCYAENVVVKASGNSGVLACSASIAERCYSIGGSITSNSYHVGGLFGSVHKKLSDSYSTCDVEGKGSVGGLVGYAPYIENCYATGNVVGTEGVYIGGLVGQFGSGPYSYSGDYVLKNSYFLGESNTLTGILVGKAHASKTIIIEDCYYTSKYDSNVLPVIGNVTGTNVTINNVNATDEEDVPFSYAKETAIEFASINFYIGGNGANESNISITTAFSLSGLESLKNIGLDANNPLSKIDEMIKKINAKQTEYGSAQNRLESALEEISTQYENLVSSRSTIRDADMAEVSSQYIQQQILQQASATLMSTANQSPAIALQLI